MERVQVVDWGSVDVVISDVDGVLTNGQLWMDGKGGVWKAYHVQDGMAIGLLKAVGVSTAFISGRSDASTRMRLVDELKVPEDNVMLNVKDKRWAIEQVVSQREVELGRSVVSVYIGDDLNDLCALEVCTYFVCPKMEYPEHPVRELAVYETKVRGGEGVLREIANRILKGKGKMPQSGAQWMELMGGVKVGVGQ